MRRVFVMAAGAIAAFVSLGAPAVAAPPTTNITEHVYRDANTFYDYSFCGDTAWELSEVETGVFHLLEKPDGTFHVTGTVTGTAEVRPISNNLIRGSEGQYIPDGPLVYTDGAETFTGRYTQWLSENGNGKSQQSGVTLSVRLVGSEGSVLRVHVLGHLTVNANGELIVEFEEGKVVGCS